jgi:sensor c-di-GMP phosphodiesterase-like protein
VVVNAQDAAITRAIITMADSLGVQVVAEGVETRAQLDFLDALGCTTMQGFLLSRPVDGAAIAELLRARRAVPSPDLTAEELEIEIGPVPTPQGGGRAQAARSH